MASKLKQSDSGEERERQYAIIVKDTFSGMRHCRDGGGEKPDNRGNGTVQLRQDRDLKMSSLPL